MTPRERFQELALAHADQLERDRRRPPVISLLILFLIAGYKLHWFPDAVTHTVDAAKPVALVALLVAMPFFLVGSARWYRQRSWLKQLVCPNCRASLSYFLTDPDYYQRSRGKGIPDSVENCPFCSLPFDVPFDDSTPEQTAPAMEVPK